MYITVLVIDIHKNRRRSHVNAKILVRFGSKRNIIRIGRLGCQWIISDMVKNNFRHIFFLGVEIVRFLILWHKIHHIVTSLELQYSQPFFSKFLKSQQHLFLPILQYILIFSLFVDKFRQLIIVKVIIHTSIITNKRLSVIDERFQILYLFRKHITDFFVILLNVSQFTVCQQRNFRFFIIYRSLIFEPLYFLDQIKSLVFRFLESIHVISNFVFDTFTLGSHQAFSRSTVDILDIDFLFICVISIIILFELQSCYTGIITFTRFSKIHESLIYLQDKLLEFRFLREKTSERIITLKDKKRHTVLIVWSKFKTGSLGGIQCHIIIRYFLRCLFSILKTKTCPRTLGIKETLSNEQYILSPLSKSLSNLTGSHSYHRRYCEFDFLSLVTIYENLPIHYNQRILFKNLYRIALHILGFLKISDSMWNGSTFRIGRNLILSSFERSEIDGIRTYKHLLGQCRDFRNRKLIRLTYPIGKQLKSFFGYPFNIFSWFLFRFPGDYFLLNGIHDSHLFQINEFPRFL